MSYNAGPSYHGLTITIFEHLQIFFSAYSLFNIKTQELSDIKIRFDIDFTENVLGFCTFNEDNIVKRVYGQFCIETLHESRKWKYNGLSCLFK